MSNAEKIARQAICDAIANGDEQSFNRASAELSQILRNKPRNANVPAQIGTRKFDI